MNSKVLIILLLILGIGYVKSYSQPTKGEEEIILFTDRDFCMSGDTLWFKTALTRLDEEYGNVVHIQLDGMGNNLISQVIKKSNNGWITGYIAIPDSLSTGQYFLTAFKNAQKNLPDLTTYCKPILVYNRFEEFVSEMTFLAPDKFEKREQNDPGLNINPAKIQYGKREKVNVHINCDHPSQIRNAVVRAALVDPLAKELDFIYRFKLISDENIPGFVENNGFLVSGKVLDSNGEPQNKVIVTLSINGEPSYFDYYVTGEKGDFHFFLKNASGSTNIYLHAISNEGKQFFVELKSNYLKRQDENNLQTKVLTSVQSDFISKMINGSFINKLFNQVNREKSDYFEMPARFKVPFYGPGADRIITDEYIELDDFREISRELLNGVQFRKRGDFITIRVVNLNQGTFFNDEPLRLLNGIPVFDNNLLSSLNSKDINYVDVLMKERIFGDLFFKGVLDVSLKDKSNNWITKKPNIFRFNIDCLQPEKKPTYSINSETGKRDPDLRQVYFWDILETDFDKSFEFLLSDLKGEVEISVEGITVENKLFKISKKIIVK